MLTIRLKHLACPTSFWLVVLLAGCSLSTVNTHPEFNARIMAIKNPVVLMSEVHMYQVSSDGTANLRDDWSAVGRRNLESAITRNLKSQQRNLTPLATDPQTAREIEEIKSLYQLVHKAMDQQAFGPSRIHSGRNGFQYCLGSLEAILQKLGADAAIFVTGYDKVAAGGRKSMIDLAIADRSGTILYYAVKGTVQGNDLRDAQSAQIMVRGLLADFLKAEG